MATWTTPKTWADDVGLSAAELNEQLRDNTQYLYDRIAARTLILSSDVTKSSASFSNLTGLTFSVANGKNYNVRGFLTYEMSSTSGGPIISFNHPGGSCRMRVAYAGETSTTSEDRDWVTTNDGGTGVATAAATGTKYAVELDLIYQCSASGTFAIRIARNTAGTATIHAGSAITIVND